MIEFNATFIVAMISFIVFMFIMNAIFYRPILNIIRKRESYINSNYKNAKNLSEKAQEFTEEYNKKLENAKSEGRKDVAHSIDKAQKESFEKVRQTKDEAKTEIKNRKDSLLQNKEDLKKTLDSGITQDLANMITSKITGNK